MAKKNQHSRPKAGTEKLDRPLKELAGAPVTEDYESSLNRVLDSIYLGMADAFSAAKLEPKLKPEMYEEILPQQVIILAAHLGLVPTLNDRSDGECVQIGPWSIDAKVRDEVLGSLASVIALVRVTENETASRWKEPTPMQHVDRFLKLITPQKQKVWSQTDLFKALSDNDPDQESAYKKCLQRWIFYEPDTYLQGIMDERTRDRLTKLVSVMTTYAPAEFGSLTLEELCWMRPSI